MSNEQVIIMKNMMPNYYAGLWVGRNKTCTLEIKDEWCKVYRGKRKIWECNSLFAKTHFSAKPEKRTC